MQRIDGSVTNPRGSGVSLDRSRLVQAGPGIPWTTTSRLEGLRVAVSQVRFWWSRRSRHIRTLTRERTCARAHVCACIGDTRYAWTAWTKKQNRGISPPHRLYGRFSGPGCFGPGIASDQCVKETYRLYRRNPARSWLEGGLYSRVVDGSVVQAPPPTCAVSLGVGT